MSKNTKIISASVRPEQDDQLKKLAKIRDMNKSELVRSLIDRYLNEESIDLESELKAWLDEFSEYRGTTVSEVANDILKRYLSPDDKSRSVASGDLFPVVLKIPTDLKGNREELSTWLNARAKYILDKLS